MQHLHGVALFVSILLHPSQQFFSHIGTRLPGLNQHKAGDKGYNTVTPPAVTWGCNSIIIAVCIRGLTTIKPHFSLIMIKKDKHEDSL